MAKTPPPPPVKLTMGYTTIEWTYSKANGSLSDMSKNQLRQMGMSSNGIAQLSTAKAISSQKDMQIVATLVSRALN